MYTLSEKTKKTLSEIIEIPYEKLIEMDDDEITAYIEQINGKKLGYSKPNPMFSGSGDDSVLIDNGRYRTMEGVDRKMDEILKYHKSKKQPKHANIEDEEVLEK